MDRKKRYLFFFFSFFLQAVVDDDQVNDALFFLCVCVCFLMEGEDIDKIECASSCLLNTQCLFSWW